jgi:hypothetical protein
MVRFFENVNRGGLITGWTFIGSGFTGPATRTGAGTKAFGFILFTVFAGLCLCALSVKAVMEAELI